MSVLRMRILYASGLHVPDHTGGAHLTLHTLLQKLVARGIECEAVSGMPSGPSLTMNRIRRRISGRQWLGSAHHRNGYPTYRAWRWLVPQLVAQRIDRFRPDVVVTQLDGRVEIAELAIARGIPTVVRIPDEYFFPEKWVKLHQTGLLLLTGGSDYVRDRFGFTTPPSYPCIDLDAFRSDERTNTFVTLINPKAVKGLDTALELASRLPERRFLFVESWPLAKDERRALRRQLRALPNVVWRSLTQDMRAVYAETAVLIVPSRWRESFGRVVVEAQVNGIPVVARDVGGLSWTVGAGGVVIPEFAPAEAWVEAVERLMSDSARYQELSAAARANALGARFQPDAIAERFLEMLQGHIEASGRSHSRETLRPRDSRLGDRANATTASSSAASDSTRLSVQR